ncbi:hypothetical protein [Natrarchaeobius chitinivorans]|uniref:Sulfatase N-terminal domain-containing protein n=1 Tax=Natrarchaeobius chitinivorans TaxID=1679083 RepID=A0A3N6PCI9_NATCH|nr:hypothetical protein [Natrarchaeobius chitinivorans]RQG97189.1 hypothetical protein EA473_03715 [Natrarchaeobius chitinivorans]
MYSPSQIRRGIQRGLSDPSFFGQELNRLYHRRLYRRECNPDGVDLLAEDWDTLFILDACRYDMFEKQHGLPGRLERRQSRASHTTEFLRANFDGKVARDTVYVTASPQLYRWREEIDVEFHDVINVWYEAGWDETHGTVMPETMADYVRRAAERYPRKRIVGHFLQPHYPFVGADDLNTTAFGDDENAPDVWNALRTGDLEASPEEVWEAYRENLDLVLPVIRSLLSELEGRTVVTSDHGNMIGERRFPIPLSEWGHPPGIYTDELVTVPWLVSENGPRRDVVSGSVDSSAERIADDVVEDRLRQLGYAD